MDKECSKEAHSSSRIANRLCASGTPSATTSRASSNHLQIFCLDHGQAIVGQIVVRPQALQLAMELLLAVLVQRRERAVRWPVVAPEEIHHFRGWKRIAESVKAAHQIQIGDPSAESFTNFGFLAPEERRRHA